MSLSEELYFLILQFCHEEGLHRTAHMFEQETGIFFDIKYFKDILLSGNWDVAENYLSGFIKLEVDNHSWKIYFEIRKQKFLEALHANDRVKALDILLKDLKVFATTNKEVYKEMAQLLTEADYSSLCRDTLYAREQMMEKLIDLIDSNPVFQDKLKSPHISSSRLRRLINQSLNWQHIQCKYPQSLPDIKTLFMDHQCPQTDHPYNQALESMPLPSESASASAVPSSCMGNSSVKATETLNQISSVTDENDLSSKPVEKVLIETSSPTSMDFHPIQQELLLVGTSNGDVGLWEAFSGEKLLSRTFHVWKFRSVSKEFLVALAKNLHPHVTCVSWSPDGSLFGVAYSRHIVHLYLYRGARNIKEHIEIDAHVGRVNDIAFSKSRKPPFLISCGEDKFIQVWDVTSGAKKYSFEGHEAPVYSVYSHVKANIDFIFSTSVNGEIKVWLYDAEGPRVSYHAPGYCSTKMAYSADGKRLFSCGTKIEGETILVEWDEDEGFVKRSYKGLTRCPSGNVVEFDTCKNQFLVAGDDHIIKIWDMDQAALLMSIEAGDLPANPKVRLSRSAELMAVTQYNNQIKILEFPLGQHLAQASENVQDDSSLLLSEVFKKLEIQGTSDRAAEGVFPGDNFGKNGDIRNWKVAEAESPAKSKEILEISKSDTIEASPCQSLWIPSEAEINEISRLMYTTSGNAVLALAANGIHLLWKWSESENNTSGKATTNVLPKLWQPRSGLFMTNDIGAVASERFAPCLALSKNNSYVLSASGGGVSLFNIMTFKKMKILVAASPVATSIAFWPHDNNIIAIGLDDSTILIYYIRTDEVLFRLESHSERVTGLAFSNILNVLVSSGADAQIVLWNTNWWEKKMSKMMDIPDCPSVSSNAYVQFHQDQKQVLVICETHLAIYEVPELNLVNKWDIEDLYNPITDATFSSDSQLVYASLVSGMILILDASNLRIQFVVNPAAYLPSSISSQVYPVAIAAHPKDRNQFALGLTDGSIIVVEPL